jgi:DMSO/TMAO reductase YedYZ molybdopterin-dependent catalytic subunit
MHITRGFQRRRRPVDPARVPPGQYVTEGFPVLSAEPTPNVKLDAWTFEIRGEVEHPRTWTWAEVQALPAETVTRDIHCVTKWSKLDTTWTGVSLDVLFEGTNPTGAYVLAFSDTGYTTNLPLADVMGGRAWVVWEFEGEPLDPEHGGPVRMLVPHLYFWKSAKWVRGVDVLTHDQHGFWERYGYHDYGDPWREQRYQGD